MKMITFEPVFGGLHWVFENEKGETLSVICHKGSYGWKRGLFECEYSYKDLVTTSQTFENVANLLQEFEKRK